MWFEGAQAREIVRGREDVDERQCCLHASRRRFITGATEQRIQPDQPAGTPFQQLEGCRKLFWFTSIPTVTQNDDDRALVHPAQPLIVEHREARADPRATRPAANVS